MGTPIIAGAGLWKLRGLLADGGLGGNAGALAVGMAASAIAGLIAIAANVAAPVTARAATPSCAVPETAFTDEPPLPHTVAALTAGRTVTIVAIGGASTLGRAVADQTLAWPARMAVALTHRFPKATVTAINRGVPRQTAADMLTRFKHDVLPVRPDLVVWETGTTDGVRGVDVDAFRDTLQAGIDMLHAEHIELILMDMQFSQRANAVLNLDRYSAVMRDVAVANDVAFFRRYEIMRGLAESGAIDFTLSDRNKLKAVAARLYDCVGRAVAQLIVHGQHDASAAPLGAPR
jgi:hypothetical protein